MLCVCMCVFLFVGWGGGVWAFTSGAAQRAYPAAYLPSVFKALASEQSFT